MTEYIAEVMPRSDADPTLVTTYKPVGTCCYGNCRRKSTAVFATLGSNAPAPVVMERRPFCQEHADEYARLNTRLGIAFERHPVVWVPFRCTITLVDGHETIWTRFGPNLAHTTQSAQAAAEREYGPELASVTVEPSPTDPRDA